MLQRRRYLYVTYITSVSINATLINKTFVPLLRARLPSHADPPTLIAVEIEYGAYLRENVISILYPVHVASLILPRIHYPLYLMSPFLEIYFALSLPGQNSEIPNGIVKTRGDTMFKCANGLVSNCICREIFR